MKKTKSFEFKQFKIEGGFSGMPVSTDGVLLGAWMELVQVKRLLDIGTGTGLLSLMCAQRSEQLAIEAIDIDQHALDAATNNFNHSKWSDRLTLHKGDVLRYSFNDLYDAIICNPPYFNSGQHAANSTRATARHTQTLNHEDLLRRCWQLLTAKGHACFVLPIVEGEQFIQLAIADGWFLQRKCSVKPTDKKVVSRLLIQLGKLPQDCIEESLNIHEQGQYSSDFVKLTQDFYLKM
jgi:tRNA1Val (adenine37-N6)-methyltransferase